MIVVRVELHSAITKKVTVLGKMFITNDGTHPDAKRGNYDVFVFKKNKVTEVLWNTVSDISRKGRVENYPRLSYNIWRLVARALLSAFPEEDKQ